MAKRARQRRHYQRQRAGRITFPLLQHGHYLQRTINEDVVPAEHRMSLTRDFGTLWTDRGPLPAKTLRGPISVRGSSLVPTAFEAIDIDGTTADGFKRRVIARMTNIYGPGDLQVTPLASPDFESLGTFPTEFAWYRVFAVNPGDKRRIIAPDLGSGEVKVTHDEGLTWQVDAALTAAVTSDGALRMTKVTGTVDGILLVNFIEFHPTLPCVVLVGTAQNGLFFTLDSGQRWYPVPGSQKVIRCILGVFRLTHVCRGFVVRQRPVVDVASFHPRLSGDGRGAPDSAIAGRRRILATGRKSSPGSGNDGPQVCPRCTLVSVTSGAITELSLDGDRVRGLAISSGYARQTDRSLRPIPASVPMTVRSGGRLLTKHPVLEKAAARKLPIRALVLDGDRLQGIVRNPRAPSPTRARTVRCHPERRAVGWPGDNRRGRPDPAPDPRLRAHNEGRIGSGDLAGGRAG